MMIEHYVAEQLWNEREQEWERKVRRGDFIDDGAPRVSILKKIFSDRKANRNRLSEKKNPPVCSQADITEK